MPNAVSKKKQKITITVEVSYDPERIQRTINLAKIVDIAGDIEEAAWEKHPVHTAILVVSAQQLLNVSHELEIEFGISRSEGDWMFAKNF